MTRRARVLTALVGLGAAAWTATALQSERGSGTGRIAAHAAGPVLDGLWDFRPVKGKVLGAPPTDDGFLNQAIHVPGLWADRDATDLYGYPRSWQDDDAAWYRTIFDAPAVAPGHRLALEFESLDYHGIVFVNGKRVGEHAGSFTPFEIDITDAVRHDGSNTLLVGVVNWSAAIAGNGLASDLKRTSRSVPVRLTAPVGMLDNPAVPNDGGISGRVRLVTYPEAHIQSVAIRTSVRSWTIGTDVCVRNDGDADRTVVVTGRVLDAGRLVLVLPDARVHVPARGTVSVTQAEAWPHPTLWEPDTPHLYQLVTTTTTTTEAGGVDQHLERFGFRECWIDGRDFILNGKRLVLRATTDPYHLVFFSNRLVDSTAPGATAPEAVRMGIRDSFARLRRMHVNTVRLPVPTQAQLDLADQTGLLVVDESMVSGVLNEIPTESGPFWTAARAQVDDWVVRDRNHPSVVIWSVENEVLNGRNGDEGLTGQLVDLARQVRARDSTRPLMFEGDGDPAGTADLINLHYPSTAPSDACAPLFSRNPPIPLDSFPTALTSWRKPLYIGEFGWSLARGFYKPEEYSRFIREYRNSGVAGIAPFLMQEASADAFQPLTVFVDACPDRPGGARAVVHNDLLERARVHLTWQVLRGNDTLASGARDLELEPGEMASVATPWTGGSGAVRVRATLARGGTVVARDDQPADDRPSGGGCP